LLTILLYIFILPVSLILLGCQGFDKLSKEQQPDGFYPVWLLF